MRTCRSIPVIALLLVASCKGDNRSAADARATTLVMTLPADADQLIPVFSINETSAQVSAVVFEKLAEIGDSLNTVGDGGFRPSLADSWTWSKDSLSIAFHIAPKAHWHDGVPVRASDVVYSFHLNTSKDIGSPTAPLLAGVDSVTAPDSLTAVFWYHRRSPEQFFNSAAQIYVLPAHLLKSIPDSALKTSPFARSPIGSGPFRFVRWVSGATIELRADSAFHRGRPKLDRLIWSIAPDPDASMLRLFSGESNFSEYLRPQDQEQIKKHPELKAVNYPSMLVYYVEFNLRARKGRTPHAIFADRDVRRALTMAIDRERAVHTVIDSSTKVLLGPFSSVLSTYDSTVSRLPYSADSANAILARRGWVMGADSIRHKGGVPLRFSILVPTTSVVRQQMALLLQDMFKRVGARMDIERIDFAALGGTMVAHDFDLAFVGAGLDPTPSGIRQEWSTAAANGEGTSNNGHYTNAAFDVLIDSAVNDMDPAAAAAHYHKAYEIIIQDAPAIWMYEGASVAGMAKNVHPAPMRADYWFVHLADWTIGDGPAPKGASVALAAGTH